MAGDGFKNYYTFAYQYKYGHGIHFEGFMYPYGDLATYADAQILLVWILQGIRSLGLDTEPYLLGILNTLPLLSFVFAGLFLIRIFEYYKVSYPYALLFSLVTVALSPQVFRVQSHYALAYAYLIPAVWWININKEESISRSWIWISIACLIVLAHGFMHPYLIFIVSLFLLSLFVSELLVKRKISFNLLLQGLLPIVSFLFIMKGLDSITDRPKNPYGLLIHKTEVSDLLPFYGWIKNIFGDILLLRNNYSEGYSYVGILIFIVPLLLLVRRAFKQKDQVQDEIVISKSLWSYLIAGLFCLFCGMGLHIILSGGLLLDIVPMVKQFRAMGRVSWIFYYSMIVFLAVVFYRMLDSIENKVFKWSVLMIAVGLWVSDIYSYHKSLNTIVKTYQSNDLLNTSTLVADMLDQENINSSRYQALWVLPSSSEGTEKISFRDDWSSKMNAIPFSYQTGLPLTSIVMSRSSISKSLKIMQLSSSEYVEKEILKDFTSEKPLLIILQNDRLELFEDILAKAKFIGKRKDFSLYEINMEELQAVSKIDVSQGSGTRDSISSNGIFLDFEDSENAGMLSKGCKLVNGVDDIFEINLDLQDSVSYSLSLWYKILAAKTNVPSFKIQTFDSTGVVRLENDFRDWDMQRVEVIDNWIRLKRSYKLNVGDKRIRLSANGEFLFLDRVLLKQDKVDFKAETLDSTYMQWNHIIGEKAL